MPRRLVSSPIEDWKIKAESNGDALASFVSHSILELPSCRFATVLEGAKDSELLSFSFEAGFRTDESRPDAACVSCNFKTGETKTKRGYIPVCWGGTDPLKRHPTRLADDDEFPF